MDPVILQGADHLETGPVPHVGQPRIAVAAEVPLQDSPVLGPVEQRSPGLQLAHARGSLFGVELGHSPVIQVLAPAHRVGEVDSPGIPLIHVGQCRGDASLRHYRVGLPEKRLAHQPHRNLGGRRRDGGAQPRASGADDQHIVLVGLDLRHQKNLQSDQRPSDSIRT